MPALLVILGVMILVVAGVDVLWTVLAAGSGAGPITARLSGLAWRVALALDRRDDNPRHGLLGVFGMVIVVAMLVSWILVAWGAWLLIASGAGGRWPANCSLVPPEVSQPTKDPAQSVAVTGSSARMRPGWA